MTSKKNALKRYNLVLPEELFDEIQQIADNRQTSVVDILRRFIKLGLLADQIERSPDSGLFIREGNIEKHIILV